MTIVDWLLAWTVLGLLPGFIAQRKGYSFVGWWIFGALLFIVALPWALLMGQNKDKQRQCPACRTWIDRQASVCAQCGRDVPAPEELPAEIRPWNRP